MLSTRLWDRLQAYSLPEIAAPKDGRGTMERDPYISYTKVHTFRVTLYWTERDGVWTWIPDEKTRTYTTKTGKVLPRYGYHRHGEFGGHWKRTPKLGTHDRVFELEPFEGSTPITFECLGVPSYPRAGAGAFKAHGVAPEDYNDLPEKLTAKEKARIHAAVKEGLALVVEREGLEFVPFGKDTLDLEKTDLGLEALW